MPEEKLVAGLAEDEDEEFQPPNGGSEAWLLVLAGFLVFANTWYAPFRLSSQPLSQ